MSLSGPRFDETDPYSLRENRYHLVGVTSRFTHAINALFHEAENGLPSLRPTKLPTLHHPFGSKDHGSILTFSFDHQLIEILLD